VRSQDLDCSFLDSDLGSRSLILPHTAMPSCDCCLHTEKVLYRLSVTSGLPCPDRYKNAASEQIRKKNRPLPEKLVYPHRLTVIQC
jgi:hypothetical protein